MSLFYGYIHSFVYNDTKNNITVKCRIFQGVTFLFNYTKRSFLWQMKTRWGIFPSKVDIADVPSSDVLHVSAIFLQPC